MSVVTAEALQKFKAAFCENEPTEAETKVSPVKAKKLLEKQYQLELVVKRQMAGIDHTRPN
jgi:hypothetical protein